MKTSVLFVAAALAVSVSAQNFQQNNRNNNLGGSRGGFGNNQNNGFFGQNGKNGQTTQNKNQGQAAQGQNRAAQNNNNNGNKGQAAPPAKAATTAKAAATGKATAAATTAAVAATGAAAAGTAAAAATAAAATGAAAATATAAAAGANSADAQASTTLDPKVIATGFEDDGQDVPTAGQVASLTSSNNFINFCLTVPNLPITNGKQITTGSCNPAPMGIIPSTDNMPSAKFTVPKNGDSLVENTPFTITMAVANFQTGAFVNAAENYFAAPQQVNAQGQIIGHSHVVVEQLTSLDQTTPTDPKKFAFFKGLNAAAVNGLLTASVDAGLPAGFYKVSSINTAANHQPVLVPIAQHGSLDDVSYFTVTAAGANATASTATPAAGSVAAAAASASAAAGKAVIAPAPVRGTVTPPPQAAAPAKAAPAKAAPAPAKAAPAKAAPAPAKAAPAKAAPAPAKAAPAKAAPAPAKAAPQKATQQTNGRNRRHARAFAQL